MSSLPRHFSQLFLGFTALTAFLGSAAAGEGVLLVGDSHFTGQVSPGTFLDREIRALQPKLTTYGVCGASTASWLKGPKTKCGLDFRSPTQSRSVPYPQSAQAPKFAEVLASAKPGLVIVALGSNMAVQGYSLTTLAGEVAQMSALITAANARCVWITPMNARSIQGRSRSATEAALAKVRDTVWAASAGYCDRIDGGVVMDYPERGGDGLHYSSLPGNAAREMSDEWAKAMLDALRNSLSAE